MTDLAPSRNLADLPAAIESQFQTLLAYIGLVENHDLSNQVIEQLAVLYDDMGEAMRQLGAVLQDAVSQRDTALDNLAVAIDQRDYTQILLTDLTNAVRRGDRDHPLVEHLAEEIADEFAMGQEEYYQDNIARLIESYTDMDYYKARDVAFALLQGEDSEEITEQAVVSALKEFALTVDGLYGNE